MATFNLCIQNIPKFIFYALISIFVCPLNGLIAKLLRKRFIQRKSSTDYNKITSRNMIFDICELMQIT